MVVSSILNRLRGEGTSDESGQPADPSHVCKSCGEKYFAKPDVEIRTCRACGGIRVEAA